MATIMTEAFSDPICDFCSGQPIIGVIPMEPFTVTKEIPGERPLQWGYDGGWAVCATCSILVQSGRVDDLSEHSLNTYGASYPGEFGTAERRVLRENLKLIHGEFFKRWNDRGRPGPVPLPNYDQKATYEPEGFRCPAEYAERDTYARQKKALSLKACMDYALDRWGHRMMREAIYQNEFTQEPSFLFDWLEKAATAPLVLWEHAIWNHATTIKGDTFRKVQMPMESITPQLWTWDTAPEGMSAERTLSCVRLDSTWKCAGMYVIPVAYRGRNEGINFCPVYVKSEGPKHGPQPVFLPRLVFLNSIWNGQTWCDSLAAVSQAALSFMQMEWVGLERKRFNRSTEQAIEKQSPRTKPEIQTVAIRRTAREEAKSGSGSGKVDWSCCWEVSGHWRKQFYPSLETPDGKGGHKPKYIKPYKKGPDEKPFRTKDGTLYVVKR